MGDFLRIILDSIQFLWPFRIVQEWERGVYYFCGKSVGECRAGIPYPVIPWFCEIKTLTSVQDTVTTPLQTITTRDGGTLTFNATAQIRIENATFAYNKVAQYTETVVEDIAAILAEKLAEIDPERLAPEHRGRLIGACKQSLAATVGEYGVVIITLRFNNFVRNIRVYRFFNDQLFGGKDG